MPNVTAVQYTPQRNTPQNQPDPALATSKAYSTEYTVYSTMRPSGLECQAKEPERYFKVVGATLKKTTISLFTRNRVCVPAKYKRNFRGIRPACQYTRHVRNSSGHTVPRHPSTNRRNPLEFRTFCARVRWQQREPPHPSCYGRRLRFSPMQLNIANPNPNPKDQLAVRLEVACCVASLLLRYCDGTPRVASHGGLPAAVSEHAEE